MQNRRQFLAQSVATSLAAAAALNSSAEAQDNEWALKMFDKRSHDFGVVAKGAEANYRLKVKNLYQDDVHIAEVTTTCGCTAGKPSQETLKRLEEGYISISMNTIKFDRHKDSNVIVIFDKPRYAKVTIPIVAYIRTDVVLDPGSAQFGTIYREDRNAKTIRIQYAGRSDWHIKDVKTNHEHLVAKVVETARASGRVDYDLVVEVGSGAPFGALRQYISLVTDDATNPNVPILVEAEIRPDISVDPAVVSLGMMTPGQSKTVSVVLKGKKPFEVENVTCEKVRDVFQVRLPKTAAPVQIIQLTVIAPDKPGSTLDEELTVTIPGRAEPIKFRAYAKIVAPGS